MYSPLLEHLNLLKRREQSNLRALFDKLGTYNRRLCTQYNPLRDGFFRSQTIQFQSSMKVNENFSDQLDIWVSPQFRKYSNETISAPTLWKCFDAPNAKYMCPIKR
jgi:hypothetical protein